MTSATVNALTPYIGLVGAAAQNALNAKSLSLPIDQATALTNGAYNGIYNDLVTKYNSAAAANGNSFTTFPELPANTQTAIMDLAYMFGLASGSKLFTYQIWSQVTSGKWQDAINNLRNWTGDVQHNLDRHKYGANLIQTDTN